MKKLFLMLIFSLFFLLITNVEAGTLTVTIDTPADSSSYNVGGSFTLTATASCAVSNCENVDLTASFSSGISTATTNPQSCGQIKKNKNCAQSWTIDTDSVGSKTVTATADSSNSASASDNIGVTINAVCGNGVIESGEDCDGANLGGETCVSQGFESGTLSCSSCSFDTSDCVVPASCGDGTCQSGESCLSCSDDCGICPESEGTTTIISEGGGMQQVIGIFPRSPLNGDLIEHGPLELRVQIYYGGRESNSATVKANSSMFGEVELIHNYDLPKGMYTADVTIGKDTTEGRQRIVYTAKQEGEFNEVPLTIEIEKGLKINMDFGDEYFKGSRMGFEGTVLNPDGTIANNATITISGYKDNQIFERITTTDENGRFSEGYIVKYSDIEGIWNIVVEAVSQEENVGTLTLSPHIEVPTDVIYYSVNFLSPLIDTFFRRGEVVPISIEVKEDDKLVEGASVFIYTPKDEKVDLKEVEPGRYSGNYIIEPSVTVGDWYLKAEVSKQIGEIKKVGGTSLPIKIGSTEIVFNLVSPGTDVIYTNSRLNIKTKLTYPDGSLVKGADLNAYLSNGEIIKLYEKYGGIYKGSSFITLDELGTLNIDINANDASGNFGSLKQTLFVRKRSAVGNIIAYGYEGILRYWWAILLFLIVGGYFYKPTFETKLLNRRIRKAIEEQTKIKDMQIEAEQKYYKAGSITKKDFNDLRTKYEERLAKAKEIERVAKSSLNQKLSKSK